MHDYITGIIYMCRKSTNTCTDEFKQYVESKVHIQSPKSLYKLTENEVGRRGAVRAVGTAAVGERLVICPATLLDCSMPPTDSAQKKCN